MSEPQAIADRVLSFGQTREGGSHLNYSVYHDRYQRTPDGRRFAT